MEASGLFEVDDDLLCLVNVEEDVVIVTPSSQFLYLLPVGRMEAPL